MTSQAETSEQSAAGSLPAGAEPRDESVGRFLSRQRRLRGIQLEELAALTHIPLRSLQRLESGEFDGQSDGFVRGFVRTVAAGLGLDPDDAVSRLLSEVHPGERAGSRTLPGGRDVVLALSLVVALAAGIGVVRVAVGLARSSQSASLPIIHRQDPVRALAEAARAAELDRPGELDPGPQPAAPPRSRAGAAVTALAE